MDLPASVPLFPLPDHVLLIGLPMTYRIFEPRYRALVDDLLGREPEDRWLAMPCLAVGWEADYGGQPAIVPIACLAKALSIRPLAEGQFLVVIEGRWRCELHECPSLQPFRIARPVLRFDQSEDPATVTSELEAVLAQVGRLLRSLGPRGEPLARLIDEQGDPAAMIDRLGAALLQAVGQRQEFLESRTLYARLVILRQLLDVLAVCRAPAGPSVN